MKSYGDVAIEWAQNKGNDPKAAAKGSRMYFRGPTIYSYRDSWPIAQFVRNAHGELCCLFRTDTYSPSTSRHKSHAYRALRTYYHGPVFRIEPPQYGYEATPAWLADRFDEYLSLLSEPREKIRKARRRKAEYAHAIQGWIREMAQFAEFFGLQWPVDVNTDLEMLEARMIVEHGVNP